jgi:hypothetical protein
MEEIYMPGDGFDPKIVVKKWFTGLIYAAIPFVGLYTADFLDAETPNLPPEWAIYIPVIVAFIHAMVNAYKHWSD